MPVKEQSRVSISKFRRLTTVNGSLHTTKISDSVSYKIFSENPASFHIHSLIFVKTNHSSNRETGVSGLEATTYPSRV